nr:uncharacterized protein LOC127319676 [Lolium perenne]
MLQIAPKSAPNHHLLNLELRPAPEPLEFPPSGPYLVRPAVPHLVLPPVPMAASSSAPCWPARLQQVLRLKALAGHHLQALIPLCLLGSRMKIWMTPIWKYDWLIEQIFAVILWAWGSECSSLRR